MTQAIILAIVAHMAWTIGNLLNVRLSRIITPLQTILWQTIFLVLILFPIVIFKPVRLTADAVILTSVLSVALYSGSLLFYTALRKGVTQISGAITATVPALIALFSIVFLGASLSRVSAVIIAVITCGLIVVSWPKKGSKVDASVGYSIGAVILWAIYFTFITKSIDMLGPYWANYISVLAGTLFLLIYSSVRYTGKPEKITKESLQLVAFSAVFIGGAPLAYNLALEHAPATVVAPIAGSYAALFIVSSAVIFKDTIDKRQWMGIFITISGVILFSIVNS